MSKAAMLQNLDPIVSWLTDKTGEVELKGKNKETWDRINVMHGLIQKHYRKSKVVTAFAKLYPEVSQATCYRYWDKTQQVLGSTHRTNRNYADLQFEELLLKTIKKAEEKKDLPTLARLLKELREFRNDQAKRTTDAEKIQPHTYIISVDPSTIGIAPEPFEKVEKMIEELDLSQSLSEQLLKEAKDTPYIDVSNESE